MFAHFQKCPVENCPLYNCAAACTTLVHTCVPKKKELPPIVARPASGQPRVLPCGPTPRRRLVIRQACPSSLSSRHRRCREVCSKRSTVMQLRLQRNPSLDEAASVSWAAVGLRDYAPYAHGLRDEAEDAARLSRALHAQAVAKDRQQRATKRAAVDSSASADRECATSCPTTSVRRTVSAFFAFVAICVASFAKLTALTASHIPAVTTAVTTAVIRYRRLRAGRRDSVRSRCCPPPSSAFPACSLLSGTPSRARVASVREKITLKLERYIVFQLRPRAAGAPDLRSSVSYGVSQAPCGGISVSIGRKCHRHKMRSGTADADRKMYSLVNCLVRNIISFQVRA